MQIEQRGFNLLESLMLIDSILLNCTKIQFNKGNMVLVFSVCAHWAIPAQVKPATWVGSWQWLQALQQHQILLDLSAEVILHQTHFFETDFEIISLGSLVGGPHAEP